MTTSKPSQCWTLGLILLMAIVVIGGTVACLRYTPSQPIEISTPASQEPPGEIYIGGAVANPGFYPRKAGDSIETLIQAAGGITSDADLTRLELHIPQMVEPEQPQRVDINRAESWLLQALPGIGEVRAQAIINYRHQHGPFHNINEVTKVEGIGTTTYEQIKHLITVMD